MSAAARTAAGLAVEPAVSPSDIEQFIRFPFALYRGTPHWVPPLLMERRAFMDPRKNPVFEYARVQPFLARRDGRVAGTICAVRNDRYNEYHPEDAQVGFFGLFECGDDPEAARALFDAAGAWLAREGRSVMRGPVNLTTNDVLGLLIEGFDDDPALLMPYNLPYMQRLFEDAGFTKSKDLLSFELRSEQCRDGQILEKIAQRILARGRCTIRPIDLKHFRDEIEFVRRCYNEAWKDNWGFVPWTDREMEFMAKELKPLVDPRMALVGLVDGKPAGISISVPDANQAMKPLNGHLFPFGIVRLLWKLKVKGCNRLRVAALGVLPEHRRLGLDVLFIWKTIVNGLPLGFTTSELGWILEDNEAMIGPLVNIGARPTKRFRIYDRPTAR